MPRMTNTEILAARKRLGMTQTQFAAALGIRSYLGVIEWEKGRRGMHPLRQEKLEALLAALPKGEDGGGSESGTLQAQPKIEVQA